MTERVVGAFGGAVTGALFAGVSAVRHAKSLHPRGVVREATLTTAGNGPAGSALLGRPGKHRALVRFSRALGIPHPLPDLLGMAIRVLDAYGPGSHQDLLLVSTVDAPVLHHLFVPSPTARSRPYTSSLPYGAGGERFLIGAVPDGEAFALSVAPMMGRFSPVGRIELGARLAGGANDITFNVGVHTGGGLAPVGVLNRMRDLAYPMSQWGWQRAGADARTLTEAVPGA
ncbi:MAG: hypothetical protein ACJ762_20690 [Solirubrobacteraceae bacterium]